MGWNEATFSQVIIEGDLPSSGLFVYSATPGSGDLSISIAAAAGTDDFGNAYPAGLNIEGAGMITVSEPASIRFLSGQPFEATPGNIAANFGGSPEFLYLGINGPSANVSDRGDFVSANFLSANDLGTSSANLEFVYNDTTGGFHEYAALDTTGFNIFTGSITAAHPGSGVATPAVAETWQQLGTGLGATWTVNQTRYRMSAEFEVMIDIAINAQAGGGATGTFTFANSLPPAYQFQGNYSRAYPLGYNGTITAAQDFPCLLIDGAGATFPGRVRIVLPALPATSNVGGAIRIPLT